MASSYIGGDSISLRPRAPAGFRDRIRAVVPDADDGLVEALWLAVYPMIPARCWWRAPARESVVRYRERMRAAWAPLVDSDERLGQIVETLVELRAQDDDEQAEHVGLYPQHPAPEAPKRKDPPRRRLRAWRDQQEKRRAGLESALADIVARAREESFDGGEFMAYQARQIRDGLSQAIESAGQIEEHFEAPRGAPERFEERRKMIAEALGALRSHGYRVANTEDSVAVLVVQRLLSEVGQEVAQSTARELILEVLSE